MATQALVRIGELATRAGVSTRTIDFYTGLGLLTPSGRTAGNFRLYDTVLVERIAVIRRLESAGVSLDEIASALHSPHGDQVVEAISKLERDIHTLQQVAHESGDDISALLWVVLTRAHSLVGAAIDLALAIHPSA